MSLKNTKDLSKFFSKENLNFLKNISSELSKIDNLIEQNQTKLEKYSIYLSALNSKDFSHTNKEYFLDVKKIYKLLEKNQDTLKNLKNVSSVLSAKLLSLLLENNDEKVTTKLVSDINSNLNKYIEILTKMKKDFIPNNVSINTFDRYHSTKLLLKTFELDLGEKLSENLTLLSPNSTDSQIKTAYSDLVGNTENDVLIISEKEKKVYLPYKKTELKAYLSQYPSSYYSFKNVIEKEFILPLEYFMNNQSMARFRETYSLYRDREASSPLEAIKVATSLAFKANLNPAIIAACKTKKQLNNYLLCLNDNHVEEFKDFQIIYDMNPSIK